MRITQWKKLEKPTLSLFPKKHPFLHTVQGYLRFYLGIENLILPMLSYPGCHVRDLYIGCIGTHTHGRQAMSSCHVPSQRIHELLGAFFST